VTVPLVRWQVPEIDAFVVERARQIGSGHRSRHTIRCIAFYFPLYPRRERRNDLRRLNKAYGIQSQHFSTQDDHVYK